MKTIIYLPLIALIALCSCKSNSFTNQRYTNYKHSVAKKTDHKPEVVKTTPVTEEYALTEIVQPQPKEENFVFASVNSVKETVKSLKPSNSKRAFKHEDINYPNYNNLVNKSNSQAFGSKISVKEKVQHARGLIGSAFLTAIWIILVIIFIFLILIVLGAIF